MTTPPTETSATESSTDSISRTDTSQPNSNNFDQLSSLRRAIAEAEAGISARARTGDIDTNHNTVTTETATATATAEAMPPPPPPSASYLLKFDTDSEDSEPDGSVSNTPAVTARGERAARRANAAAAAAAATSSSAAANRSTAAATTATAVSASANYSAADQLQSLRAAIAAAESGTMGNNSSNSSPRTSPRNMSSTAAALAIAEATKRIRSTSLGDVSDNGRSSNGGKSKGLTLSPMKIDAAAAQQQQGGDNKTPKNKKRKKKKKKKKGKGKGSTGSNDGAEDGEEGCASTPENGESPLQQKMAAAAAASDNGKGKTTNGSIRNQTKKPSKLKQSVSFGTVNVREYKRTMSTDAVPADGGWPLGLSDEVLREFSPGTVEDFEHRRQIELKERFVETMEQRRARMERKRGGGGSGKGRARSGSDASAASLPSTGNSGTLPARLHRSHSEPIAIQSPRGEHLETRPFDYISSDKVKARHRLRAMDAAGEDSRQQAELLELLGDGKNLLFGTLHEGQRMDVLIRDAEHFKDGVEAVDAEEHSSRFGSPSRGGGKRERSSSNADQHHPPSPTRRMTRRTRSNSHVDGYKPNDYYTHADVLHVRNELEQLRAHRGGVGRNGCQCRKLHVMLPGDAPKGKRRKHHRLTERRVKEELRKRGAMHGDNLKRGREELEQLLHDLVEKEPCCWTDDCPCVHNGIECQADVCSCWHPGHDSTTDKHKKSKETVSDVAGEGPEAIKERCGNRWGCYVVDFDTINTYRRRIILGPPLSATTNENGMQLCSPVRNGSP